MKTDLIKEFIETTNDITMIETIELMGEVIKEYKLMEDTIDQAYNRKLSNIERKHSSKINNKIPGFKGIRNDIANDWKADKIEKLNKWKEKYSTMNAKGKKSLLDKIRLGYAQVNPKTIRNLKGVGIGLGIAGMGIASYKAFKKDKD